MVDIARFFMDFTQDESCGKCTPCRVGTRRMLEILNRICEGKGRTGDIERLEELCKKIMATSLCGLGQGAPNPVVSTLRFFRDEYEAHIYEKRCPAKVCQALIKYEIDPDDLHRLHRLRAQLPGQRHHRRAPPAAHDRPGCLHPLRHLHAGLQL